MLDSTAFGRVPSTSSASLRQLSEFASKSGSTVYVPETVVQESHARIRASLLKSHTDARKSLHDLLDMGALADRIELPSLAAMQAAATAAFDAGIETLGFKRVPTPAVPHDEIVARMHNGLKPFGRGDSKREDGYRDYLVWRTALTAVTEGGEPGLVFISGDANAFAEKGEEDQLAIALAEEAAGLKTEVLWRRDVAAFLREEGQPFLDARSAEIRAEVDRLLVEGKVEEFVIENFRDVSADVLGFDPGELGLHPFLDDLTIVGIESLGKLRLTELIALTADFGTARVSSEEAVLVLTQIVDADDPPESSNNSSLVVELKRLSRRTALATARVSGSGVVFDISFERTDDGQFELRDAELVAVEEFGE